MTDQHDNPESGTPIPARADFPVEWEDEIEPTLLWSWDDFHSPLPKTQMTNSVASASSRNGMTEATKATGTYRGGGRNKIVNGYPYSASTAAPLTDDEIQEKSKTIEPHIQSVRSNWDNDWLPELEKDLEWMKTVKFDELSASELWETIEEFLKLHTRHWYIHHMVVMPVIAQSNKLQKLCEKILDQKDESISSRLLHGAETMTIRSIRELDGLVQKARANGELAETLKSEGSPGAKTEALASTQAGADWLATLDSYLHEFGYRCTGFDLSFPTWVEDRSFVYQVIQNMLQAEDDGTDAYEQRNSELDRERDELLARLRSAASEDPGQLEEFEREYELAQQTWPLKENHSHYIDQASVALMRIAIAEVGTRLASVGVMGIPDDVWYIDLDEAKDSLLNDPPEGLQDTIRQRQQDRERFSKLTPPKHIGTYPSDFEDKESAGGHQEGQGTLRGTAASAGQAAGVARVVLSPDDFHKVRKGDVLICRSTAPMWTPLFRIISGLVSEAGGILSHPAVVAREFKLPAVVGVPNATSLVKDGQPVSVSGTDGIVSLS